jgi:hypothetical protein
MFISFWFLFNSIVCKLSYFYVFNHIKYYYLLFSLCKKLWNLEKFYCFFCFFKYYKSYYFFIFFLIILYYFTADYSHFKCYSLHYISFFIWLIYQETFSEFFPNMPESDLKSNFDSNSSFNIVNLEHIFCFKQYFYYHMKFVFWSDYPSNCLTVYSMSL